MTSRKSSLLAAALILIPMAFAAANSAELQVVGPMALGVTEEGNVTFGYETAFIETEEGKGLFSRQALQIWMEYGLFPHPKGAETTEQDGVERYMLEVVVPDTYGPDRAEEIRQGVMAILISLR